MSDYEIMSVIAEAFASGTTEPLADLLDENCEYISDYSSTKLQGRENIIKRMNHIFSNITEKDVYTYNIVDFDELSKPERWDIEARKSICAHFVELHQYKDVYPVAIVYAQAKENGKVDKIVLSRDGKLFDVIFYKEEVSSDSEEDIPNTIYNDENEELYVWRQADAFIGKFLKKNEYEMSEFQAFEDCIGYHCSRRDISYTVYVFAYGKEKNISWGEQYYDKLMKLEYSKNSKVLAVYLHVKRYRDKKGYRYEVLSYNDSNSVEIWLLNNVAGKKMFCFYPSEEMSELVDLLIYAYNNQDEDIYDWIIEKKNPRVECASGNYSNFEFFRHLKYLKAEYGAMRKGYVRYNDLVYSIVPYIENYGYWSFSVNQQDKIDFLKWYDFDDDYEEFIFGEEETFTLDIPKMKRVSVLPRRKGERFALVVEFLNGDKKRYQLPIDLKDSEKEVVSYDRRDFSDDIWNSATITNSGCKVVFSNKYMISYVRVHGDGSDYVEETGEFKIKRKRDVFIFQGDTTDGCGIGRISGSDYGNSLYLFDEENRTVRRLPEEYQGTPIMISPMCGGYYSGLIMVSLYDEMDLYYHHNRSGCAGMWGWLDKDFNMVIEPQYIFAEHFQGGFAEVARGKWLLQENGRYDWEDEAWGVIDITGKEVISCKYDELYSVDDSDHLYLAHKGGWENGNYCIVDRISGEEIIQMDFDFDAGYMFNEMFETEDNKLVFIDHQPGEEKDLVTVFDLNTKQYLLKQEVYTERTYNGESRVVVEKDGKQMIVF